MFSRAMSSSSPVALHFFSIFFADFTADSAFPFALLLYGEIVMCLIPSFRVKSSKSFDENGGPLSLMMVSGMPYLPK